MDRAIQAVIHNLLSPDEQRALVRCETRISDNLAGYLIVGTELRRVREDDLYRGTHPDDFEGYCLDRWGISLRYAECQMAAADIAEVLTRTNCAPGGALPAPASEAVARALREKVPEQYRTAVWAIAVGESTTGKPTAALVVRVWVIFEAALSGQVVDPGAVRQANAQTAIEMLLVKDGKFWRVVDRRVRDFAARSESAEGELLKKIVRVLRAGQELSDALADMVPENVRILPKRLPAP